MSLYRDIMETLTPLVEASISLALCTLVMALFPARSIDVQDQS